MTSFRIEHAPAIVIVVADVVRVAVVVAVVALLYLLMRYIFF